MRELAIIGIGIHPWGKFPEKSVHQLNLEVAQMALKDANMEWKDIQGLFAGQDPWAGIQGMLAGNVLAQDLGMTGIPVTNNYNACATGGYALRTAHLYVTSGLIDTALVVGGVSHQRALSVQPNMTNGMRPTSIARGLEFSDRRILRDLPWLHRVECLATA